MSTTIRFISITYCIITLALAQSQPDLAAVSTGLAPTAVKKYVGKQLSCHPVHQQLNATKHAMERMHSGFEIQGRFPCLRASSPAHNRILRFTSGVTPAAFLAASIKIYWFPTGRQVSLYALPD